MRSFPYNATIKGYDDEGMPQFDRAIEAADQRKWTSLFYTNGVLADNGAATNYVVTAASEGMVVVVSAGICNISGVIGIEEDSRELAIQAAESLDRIDRVVLRLNDADRTLDLYVLKGTAASVPEAPTLTRPESGEGGDIYELGIADIFIPKNTTAIQQDRIIDTRLDSHLCGIITNAIDNLNADSYFRQFAATLSAQTGEFNIWFNTVKGILGEDEAGKLLQLIQAINTQYEVVIPIEGWALNSTTNLYELTLSNAHAHEYTKKPTWGLVNVATTAEGIEAEETAFSVIKTAGFSEGEILLTATEVPETSVTIIVTVL